MNGDETKKFDKPLSAFVDAAVRVIPVYIIESRRLNPDLVEFSLGGLAGDGFKLPDHVPEVAREGSHWVVSDESNGLSFTSIAREVFTDVTAA